MSTIPAPTLSPPAPEPVDAQVGPGHREPGVVDALALAALYADEILIGTVRHTHQAMASRAFGIANRATFGAARVPQVVHDGVAGGVYGSFSLALRAVAGGLAKVGT